MSDKYVSKALALAESCALKLNLEIIEVEWVKEANVYILRIIADSENGLSIDEATDLNNLISEELDKEDFISEDYMLEVSSPGIERVLKTEVDIIKSLNDYVHIDFINDFEIMKNVYLKDIEGTLISYEDDVFVLSVNLKGRIKKISIEKNNVLLIRKAIKF